MRALAAFLILLLAGCAAPATRSPAPGPDAAPTPVAHTVAAEATADAAPSGNRSVPLHMRGQTAAGACLFAPFVAECHRTGGNGSFQVLDAPGRLLRVSGTMAWNGTLPTSVQDPVDLAVFVLHKGSDGNWTFGPGDPWATGSSPLAFDLPLGNLTAPVALVVDQSVGAPIGVGYALAMLPHDFTLDGRVDAAA